MSSSSARLVPALFVMLWATGFIGARYAMPWAEPFSFLALRFALAMLLLVVVAAAVGSARLGRRDAAHAFFAGTLIHGVYLGGVFWAIRNGMPAGMSALIIGLQPLVTSVLAGPVLGERVLIRHWLGLGIGFAGIVMVLAPRLGTALDALEPATLAACLAGMAGISIGTLWQKRFVAEADLVGGTIWQYAGATALTLGLALTFEHGDFTVTGELVFAMAWLIFVLSIGAIFLLMHLIREGAMSRVSSLFYLVPGVTAVLAWLLFDETLSAFQIAGMVVTGVGVWFATQPGTRARASR